MSKRRRQKAPAPPRATRRVSDSVLMRVLEDHMLESLSDIAATYQRLASSLGYKFMQWKEYVKASSSISVNDRWLDAASAIATWRKMCEKRRLDARAVMLIVADGASLATIMRALKKKRAYVEHHLRACLTLWSFTRRRVNAEELIRTIQNLVSAKCGLLRRMSPM
jgi:hypothetical protein